MWLSSPVPGSTAAWPSARTLTCAVRAGTHASCPSLLAARSGVVLVRIQYPLLAHRVLDLLYSPSERTPACSILWQVIQLNICAVVLGLSLILSNSLTRCLLLQKSILKNVDFFLC